MDQSVQISEQRRSRSGVGHARRVRAAGLLAMVAAGHATFMSLNGLNTNGDGGFIGLVA